MPVHHLARCLFLLIVLVPRVWAANPWLDAGVPATDRTWQGDDYVTAAQALATGKLALPRYPDPGGAAVLGRLTDLGNLAFHRNRTLPVQTRLEDFLKLQGGAKDVLKLYVRETTSTGERLNAELAKLVTFLLHTSALGMELVREFIPTVPRDSSYETRMQGLAQVSAGLATVFSGAETTLREREYYTQEDLSQILSAMAASLPRIAPILPPEFRHELRERLAVHRAVFVREEDLQNLEAMLSLLRSDT